jgi:hypothetical protein
MLLLVILLFRVLNVNILRSGAVCVAYWRKYQFGIICLEDARNGNAVCI